MYYIVPKIYNNDGVGLITKSNIILNNCKIINNKKGGISLYYCCKALLSDCEILNNDEFCIEVRNTSLKIVNSSISAEEETKHCIWILNSGWDAMSKIMKEPKDFIIENSVVKKTENIEHSIVIDGDINVYVIDSEIPDEIEIIDPKSQDSDE